MKNAFRVTCDGPTVLDLNIYTPSGENICGSVRGCTIKVLPGELNVMELIVPVEFDFLVEQDQVTATHGDSERKEALVQRIGAIEAELRQLMGELLPRVSV